MRTVPPAANGLQRTLALRHANEIRIVRSALKRRIAAGTISPSDVLLSCPSEIETMAVFQLLRSQRRWGPARCNRVLRAAQLSESKTIGSLTDRQRSLLVAVLEGPEPSVYVSRAA
ncbi:MAG TPA: hypothetical protein VHM72_11550 [Solirubrobacteraceae bacterium]|nr:hypothetical protein [Solirubrobacteraceae bacterium]